MAGEPKQISTALGSIPTEILSAISNEYINLNHIRVVTGGTNTTVSLSFHDASEATDSYLLEDKQILSNSYLDIYGLALEPGDTLFGTCNVANCYAIVQYDSTLPFGGTEGTGWQLVHSGTINDASDYTVSDLNGDADGIYQILIAGTITGSGSEYPIKIRPNNDLENNYGYGNHYSSGVYHGIFGGSGSYDGLYCSQSVDQTSTQILSQLTFNAKSGSVRVGSVQASVRTNTVNGNQAHFINNWWNNTADNITSLVVNFSDAPDFVGTIHVFATGNTEGKKLTNTLELKEQLIDPSPSFEILQLYSKDDRLYQQSSNGKILKIACEDRLQIIGGNIGTFLEATAQKKTIAGTIGANSAIAIVLPDNTSNFISLWSMTFRDATQSFDIHMRLSGVYKTPDFTPFSDTWLSWSWGGRNPSGFGISWYRGVRYGNNLNLTSSTASHLNLGIYQSGATRELHVYNRTNVAAHFVADFTYSADI